MEINAQDVKTLRDVSGAGMMEAKKALVEAGGDMEKAKEVLRARGAEIAASKAERGTGNGVVASYIHNGRVGVLVEVFVETDFVARDEKFVAFANQIALHIAGMKPEYLTEDEVPAERKAEAKDIALMSQPFVLDSSKTIEALLNEQISSFKENIKIGRFARFELGGRNIC